jgi:hypothetical protein
MFLKMCDNRRDQKGQFFQTTDKNIILIQQDRFLNNTVTDHMVYTVGIPVDKPSYVFCLSDDIIT